jgi:hypothetical protein
MDQFLLVPDETLVDIATWLPTAQDLVHFACWTCRRFKSVVGDDPAALSRVVKDREYTTIHSARLIHPTSSNSPSRWSPLKKIRSWEQMAWYEEMHATGFLNENRVGFSIGSTEIDQDEDEYEDEEFEGTIIKDNMERIQAIKAILRQFSNIQVTVEAHCGVIAPPGIATRFSRARGMTVVDEITGYDNGRLSLIDEDRVTLNAWGSRVAHVAASDSTTHPYGELARQGMGWVEIYLQLNQLVLPPRPSFYERFHVPIVASSSVIL